MKTYLRSQILYLLVMPVLLALSLTACANQPVKDSASSPSTESTHNENTSAKGEIVVFAAASLNKAFPEIAKELLADSNLEIKFSFEGSSTLVDQMKAGAKADVFAAADEKNMNKALTANLVEKPVPFTSNVLTLIVPKGNPAKITGLDKSLEGKKLVICAFGVPCGNASVELAKQLGIKLSPVSEEQKVTDVRSKVEIGEADAGLVYATDAKAAGEKVEIIPIPGTEKVTNIYPIAVSKSSSNTTGAKLFIAAVLSEKGQAILAKYGFRPLVSK